MEREVENSDNQFEQFSKALKKVAVESVKHGFFTFTVEGKIETSKNKRRQVVIKAGKEYMHNIPFEDIP